VELGQPKKTLVLGGSVGGLECAGALASLGYPTTLLLRNVLMRGCDRDMGERLTQLLKKLGVNVVQKVLPHEIQRTASGNLRVQYRDIKSGDAHEDCFDTVIVADGYENPTVGLDLEKAGLKARSGGKVPVDPQDRTSVPHIFALGATAQGKPETPTVASKAARLLARRLYGDSKECMDYTNVPFTILTPLEYAYCGATEEQAIKEHGDAGVDVYHTSFRPLEWEWQQPKAGEIPCYTKVIISKKDNRILGFHYFGPNAGEVAQGYAVAMANGVTKTVWDQTLGIHPTCAEVLIGLQYTRKANPNAVKTHC
jgi:pyruvate/2-oxoglutarate dehydrogenase complex dihydrolipoamide dehydrogenase (E3) component